MLRAEAPIVMTDPGVIAKRKLLRLRKRLVAAAETTRSASTRTRLDPPAARWAAAAETPAVLARLDASATGLDEDEVGRRLQVYGFNRVAHEEVPGWWAQLYHAARNAFNVLLAIIALVSLTTGDRSAAIIIAAMIALSVGLRFFQERRSTVAAAKLRALVSVTATVNRRDATGAAVVREVAIDGLVPGDVVRLAAGDMVPADVRILQAKDLFVSQSVLTGEALPVEKLPGAHPAANAIDAPSLCFLGTNVVSGAATAVVIATGAHTYLGSLARSVIGARPATSFEAGVRAVSLLLIRITIVMAALVFVINGLGKHNWSEAFLFALSVAVGLTPEMLPMVVSGTLALGALSMARKKVIVKRLKLHPEAGRDGHPVHRQDRARSPGTKSW